MGSFGEAQWEWTGLVYTRMLGALSNEYLEGPFLQLLATSSAPPNRGLLGLNLRKRTPIWEVDFLCRLMGLSNHL